MLRRVQERECSSPQKEVSYCLCVRQKKRRLTRTLICNRALGQYVRVQHETLILWSVGGHVTDSNTNLGKARQGKFIYIAHYIPKGDPKCFTEYTGKSTKSK